MDPIDKRMDELTDENHRLRLALDDIGRLAVSCWMDMQGRLVDDEHKRAHEALGSISKAASTALS